MAVKVSRASHVHHTPHEARPQIDPVTSVAKQNTAPTSAPATARRSQRGLRNRGHSHAMLAESADAEAGVAHGGHRRVNVKHPDELALDDIRRAHPETPPGVESERAQERTNRAHA